MQHWLVFGVSPVGPFCGFSRRLHVTEAERLRHYRWLQVQVADNSRLVDIGSSSTVYGGHFATGTGMHSIQTTTGGIVARRRVAFGTRMVLGG